MSETIATPQIKQEKIQVEISEPAKKPNDETPLWIIRGEIQNTFEAWLQTMGGMLAVNLYDELLSSLIFISWDDQIRGGKQLGKKAVRFVKNTRRNLPALAKKFQELVWSEWAQNQGWRKVFDHEIGKAQAIRRALVNQNLYPTGWISKDPGFDREEINNRAALHVMVNELPREELRAVFDLARLLLLEKDDGSGVVNAKRKAVEFVEEFRKSHPDLLEEK